MIEFHKIRLYQLTKQNLIHKATSNEYVNLLKQHIGLHSTDYLTPYLSLWARTEKFEPKALFDDLNNRNALRLRAFRGTVFVVHRDHIRDVVAAANHYLGSRIAEAEKMALKAGIDFDAIEKVIVDLFASHQELTTREIKKALAGMVTNEQFIIVQRYLEFRGVLVRASHRYITDRVIRYSPMKAWLPDINFKNIDPDQALENLMFKYIAKFGPVSLDDLCWWFPISKTLARNSLENLKEKITHFDFNDRQYIMETADYHKFMDFEPPSHGDPIVNFLPYEDHFPKAYTIRNWYISEQTASTVVNVGKIDWGQMRPTIWLNGEIIGRWELEWVDKKRSAMTVSIVNINEKLDSAVNELIENHRKGLENFVNEKMVPLMK